MTDRKIQQEPSQDVLSKVQVELDEFNGAVRELLDISQNLSTNQNVPLIVSVITEAMKVSDLKIMSMAGPYLVKYKDFFKKDGPCWTTADFEADINPQNPRKTVIIELINEYKKIYVKEMDEKIKKKMRIKIQTLLKTYATVCSLTNGYKFWPTP